MGQFRLEITAVGGHGCQREVKDGERVTGCGRAGCPDCEFASMVAEYKRRTGCNVESAKQIHWPGTSSEVVDEVVLVPYEGARTEGYAILPRIRHGSF